MNIPDYLKRYTAIRFETCSRRNTYARSTLWDYLHAVVNGGRLPSEKTDAPAWSLCNDTGNSDGTPNGLVQLDLDAVEDVEELRARLIEYGGFLAVLKTFSGSGLVALGDVGKRIANDSGLIERLIYKPLRVYLSGCGFEDNRDYRLDSACAKPCQLRFESRDRSAYISEHPCVLACDWENEQLSRHPVAVLTEAFRPAEPCSPAGLAAAIAAVGMAADVKSAMYRGASEYPARAFCVIVGPPGSQKTTLLDAVQDAARQIGVTVSDPKNAPTLREHIMLCGCDEVVETSIGDNGKAKTEKRRVERTGTPADSLLVVVDEAGQRLKSRVQDESCGSMAAMLRQCNGARITLESTVKQDRKGSFRVPAHVTALLATTPSQWADYLSGTSQDNGETRRMIELWQDAAPCDMFAGVSDKPDLDTAGEILHRLRELSELWRDADVVFIPGKDARAAFRTAREQLISAGADAPTADSLIMCYSTLLAALRAAFDGKAGEIQTCDLAAAMAILRQVFEARDKLRAECERKTAAQYKPDSAIWGEIIEWLEKSPRRDKILEKITRRPPAYRRVFDEMLAQRALVSCKDETSGKYLLRQASPEEIAKSEAQRDARTAAIDAEVRQIQNSQTPYAECPDDEKENRVLAYVTRWRGDNALVEGNRNIALNKLAYSLQGAGMWDAVARQIYEIVAANSGLGSAEIRVLMRERKKSKNN